MGEKIHEKLRHSCKESSWPVSIWPYMVGETVHKARPCLVIASEDKISREDAKRAIVKSGLLEQYPYFKLWLLRYLPTGPINAVAMDDIFCVLPLTSGTTREVYFDPTQPMRSLAMSVFIVHGETYVRRATANAIYNENGFGYITAAHAFRQRPPENMPALDPNEKFEMPFKSRSDTDTSETEQDILSQYSDSSQEVAQSGRSSLGSSQSSGEPGLGSQSEAADSGLVKELSTDFYQFLKTGEDIGFSDVSPCGSVSISQLELLGVLQDTFQSYDCAVVVVTNPTVLSFLERIKRTERDASNDIVVAKPRRADIIAWTSRGPIPGSLSELSVYMHVPLTASFATMYKFTYTEEIKMGDYGSLISDATTREVFGYLLADSQNFRTAFMVAVEPLMSKLRSTGSWRLLSTMTVSEQDSVGKSATDSSGSLVAADIIPQAKQDKDLPRLSGLEFIREAKMPAQPVEPGSRLPGPLLSRYYVSSSSGASSALAYQTSKATPAINAPRSVLSTSVPLTYSDYRLSSYASRAQSSASPPFNPQETYGRIICDGAAVSLFPSARIEKGFFFSGDQVWTCYRRNYFAISVFYELEPWLSDAKLYLEQENETPKQIQSFAISLSASVDGPAGETVELTQHTPKRDKVPQLAMKKEILAPTPPGHQHEVHGLNGFHQSFSNPGPQLPLQELTEDTQQYSVISSRSSSYQHSFERIQFKSATAKNGKRRAQQQYFRLKVELRANVQSANATEPEWVRIVEKTSHPLVVRGRSPRRSRKIPFSLSA